MPVDLFGAPAQMDPLLEIAHEKRLAVIELAAQAIGARYCGRPVGRVGTIGCFSFFPSKNLGGAGDGGMVTTNDHTLADRLRILRTHGSRERYSYESIGMNSRLDALQAAILRVKLRYLDVWTEKRRQTPSDIDFFLPIPDSRSTLPHRRSPQTHTTSITSSQSEPQAVMGCVLTCSRGEFRPKFTIPRRLIFSRHLPIFGYAGGAFPESERASPEVLSLPIYPELRAEMQRAVVRPIAELYEIG